MAYVHDPYGWSPGPPKGFGDWRALNLRLNGLRVALVLAWGGEPVWQGCEVAQRAQPQRAAEFIEDAAAAVTNATATTRWLREVLAPVGTIIALDAEGREVVDE